MAQAQGWQLDRDRLGELLEQEERRFVDDHPGSQQLFERGEKAMLSGVPMPWMTEWAGPFPVFAASAEGARFTDVDGNEYVDLCLGDTGAMTGHSPAPTVAAVAERAARGITLMLPTEDASWVGGRARAALRTAALAVRPDGDRRQPLRSSPGEGDHRPAEGPGLRLVLPRHRRRELRDRGRERDPLAARQHRAAGRSLRDHSGGRVERPRPPWSGRSSRATSPASWPSRP